MTAARVYRKGICMIPRRSVPLVREDAGEFLSRGQRAILLMVIWLLAISVVSASFGILPARWFGLKAVLILLGALAKRPRRAALSARLLFGRCFIEDRRECFLQSRLKAYP